jgi:DNA polymerase-1
VHHFTKPEELVEKGKNQKSMRDVELEEIKEFTEDADITFQLKNYLPLS